MNHFSWKGIDSSGKVRRGKMEAATKGALKKVLLEQGIALLNTKDSKLCPKKRWLTFWRTKVNPKEQIYFFMTLSILLEGGEDLLSTLKMIRVRKRTSVLGRVIEYLVKDLNRGFTFSKALKQQNEVFSPLMVNIVSVGESSGRLSEACRLVADYLEAKLNLKSKLKQAAILPIITLTFAVLIVLFIFLFIIPRFEVLFLDFEQPIPAITQKILNVSALLRSPAILLVFAFFLGLFLGARLFLRRFASLKKMKDRMVLKIYFLRDFILLSNLVYFIGALSTLLAAGMPLVDSIDQARPTISNSVMRNKAGLLSGYLNSGKSLGQSMEIVGSEYFPEDLVSAVLVGERSGNLHGMLNRVVVLFNQDLQSKIGFVVTTLQPILIILVGIIIAFIMIAVYLPIFNLASMI